MGQYTDNFNILCNKTGYQRSGRDKGQTFCVDQGLVLSWETYILIYKLVPGYVLKFFKNLLKIHSCVSSTPREPKLIDRECWSWNLNLRRQREREKEKKE